ncbi:MAG: glycoside hydrolase family 2 TIM barrel-domain containing protein [Anaerohalosphaeraceae bacterium]
MTAKKKIQCHMIGWVGILVWVLGGCGAISSDLSGISTRDSQKGKLIFEDQAFDSDWRFLRADAPGAERPEFDDSGWRILDVPHDWSIEDLPPLETTVPEYPAVSGLWRFRKGDHADWKNAEVDDSDWQQVTLPDTWEHHSDYTNENVYGWFRRGLDIPEPCKGRDFDLLLGRIDDVDEVWLNGQRLGGTGSFPPDYRTAWNVERRYRVPASLVRGDGSDILAVRVFDGNGNGGIYAAGAKTTRIGPFDTSQSASGHFTGYTVGGIGWYRKHFTVNETGKHVGVCFDGVYMNAELWINGHRLGEHPHGYTSFELDLTPYLNPTGQNNVLAVRVRNEGRNSRWYSGSGIYRHVWLTINEPIHVPTWGVFVTTPEVSKDKAVVNIACEVVNAGNKENDANVRVHLLDRQGKSVGSAECTLHLPVNQRCTAEQTIEISKPKLWSPDSPSLYVADVEVVVAGKTADAVSTRFGIRKIEVDAQRGFRLNGQEIKLKGGCLHHDNGPFGAAAIDRAEERRVELMEANGFNAVRCSHNPPSSAFLDACDRLGLLVIDEAFDQWNEMKEGNQQDYHRFFRDWSERDIASMVRRDRNHPSVVMWSIGNEIPEQFRDDATAGRLREAVLSHDLTRPVTQAICNDWGTVTRNWDTLSDPAFVHLDVGGYNYLPEKYESDHARQPNRVMMGTESYPKDAFEYWSLVEKHPYVIGDFVWTAMDYFGEAGIGHSVLSNQNDSFFMSWPWYNAWCGDLDVCGFKKPQSFYRDVVWRRSLIEMTVHSPVPTGLSEKVSGWGWPDESQSWNWPGCEGTPLQVLVYSRCQTVRLELNGRVIDEKPVSDQTKLTAGFDVPYAPGELRAMGISDGKVIAQTTLKTSGAPKKLRLIADRMSIRANRSDLCFVTVEVVDADGRRVPNAEVLVSFSVSGVGELAAQASGTPNDPASFRIPERKTYQGRCLAILRPTGAAGDITLRAEAGGIEPETLTVQVR